MIFIRSAIFNVCFYANLVLLMVFGLPLILFGLRGVMFLGRLWSLSSLWLLRTIVGLNVEYRGVSNIPRGGLIIAPKHQSAWETFALLHLFPDFTFILKRELTFVPLFGWYLKASKQIAINRSRGSLALAEAMTRAAPELAAGRRLFIFPEGTRRPAGAPPAYKFGVAGIYSAANTPCLPIALNSGLFWPRRSFLRMPGTVLVEILEPIAPGLEKQAFLELLALRLEAATDHLIAESLAADPLLAKNLARKDQIVAESEG